VPRELEKCLVLIGVIGIESSLPTSAPGGVMPLYAALRLTDVDQPAIGALVPTVHALLYVGALAAIALLLWSRRVRLHPRGFTKKWDDIGTTGFGADQSRNAKRLAFARPS
jgi:hypothetical protein